MRYYEKKHPQNPAFLQPLKNPEAVLISTTSTGEIAQLTQAVLPSFLPDRCRHCIRTAAPGLGCLHKIQTPHFPSSPDTSKMLHYKLKPHHVVPLALDLDHKTDPGLQTPSAPALCPLQFTLCQRHLVSE